MADNPYARSKPERQGWEWPALEFVLICAAAGLIGGIAYIALS